MKKTTFLVSQMDCPSEEQMIRMKLGAENSIRSLEFDLPNRKLTVLHEADEGLLLHRLEELSLGATVLKSEVAESTENPTSGSESDSNLLWQVLAINFLFFLVELVFGYFSDSMGLVADGLDMLADSFVYGLALFATTGTLALKKKIAKISGYMQLFLAVLGFAEVVRRFFWADENPDFRVMIMVSAFALFGNAYCLFLLLKSRNQEAHMKASLIFTSNDVIVNLGVIFSAILIFLTRSSYPDLIVGGLVFILVVRGALKILKLGD